MIHEILSVGMLQCNCSIFGDETTCEAIVVDPGDQIEDILAVLERPAEAFAWLERSVGTGFACWPFFMKDPCLRNLRGLAEFELLVSSLQARYPDHLGLL